MKRRIAFVVVAVLLAGGITTDTQAVTATDLDWRGTFGGTKCNYSEAWVCRGTSWSTDMATGEFEALAAIDGPSRFRVNKHQSYGAEATSTLRRTYGLQLPASAVRVNVEVTILYNEGIGISSRVPVGGGNADTFVGFNVNATHMDSAASGVSCSMPSAGWRRDDEINPYEADPLPGTVFTAVMTCRDAAAQPVDVPPGRIQINFVNFSGVGDGSCLVPLIVMNGCAASIPDYDSGAAGMHGIAKLSVEHP